MRGGGGNKGPSTEWRNIQTISILYAVKFLPSGFSSEKLQVLVCQHAVLTGQDKGICHVCTTVVNNKTHVIS